MRNNMANLDPAECIHTYYPQPVARSAWPFRIFLLLSSLLLAMFTLVQPTLLIILFPFGSMGIVLWLVQHVQRRPTFLRLSAHGVEYQTPAIRIITPWTNVKSLTNTPWGPTLLLREAAAQDEDRLFFVAAFALTFAPREIPLWVFDYAETSPLMDDLRRFAPQIVRPAALRV